MEEIKKFINWIKKTWQDERGRAFLKLGMYALFIAFATLTAVSTLNYSKEQYEINKPAIETYKEMEQYTANFIIDDVTYEYSNINSETVKIDNVYYLIKDGNFINENLGEEINQPLFKFWYFSPRFIAKLIENGEEEYETVYKDNSKKTAYLVPLKFFVSNYNGNVLAIEDDSFLEGQNIQIELTEKDKKIDKVSIDISSFYKLLDETREKYIIEIDYE